MTTIGDEVTSERLLPCPFCGHQPLSIDKWIGKHKGWQIFCQHQDCNAVGVEELSEAEAIAAWNRRSTAAPPQALRDRVERLEGERDAYKLSAEYESGDPDAALRIKRMLARLVEAVKRVEVLEAALKPFADLGEVVLSEAPAGAVAAWSFAGSAGPHLITLDAFRTARAALNTGEPKQ